MVNLKSFLFFPVKQRISIKQIQKGLENTRWPGRFDLKGNVLIDSAHNPEGMITLFNELKYLHYDKLIVVAGFSKDKNIKEISKVLKADKIILTKAKNEKAYSPNLIKKYFKKPIVIENPAKALEFAKKTAKKEDLILVTGSIYMIGEII